MPRLIFTPWKELSELLSVRDHFYPPPSHNGPDMRAQACALVSKRFIIAFSPCSYFLALKFSKLLMEFILIVSRLRSGNCVGGFLMRSSRLHF